MGPSLIVMPYLETNLIFGMNGPAIRKLLQVDTFILQRAPKAFYKDIIHPSAFAIHGYLDLMLFE